MSEAPLPDLLGALADLRRFWERPDRKRRFLAELGEPVELAVLRTLYAVERLDADAASAAPGVGGVADALMVDGSTASRLVDQAARAGYLERLPGRDDRRRSILALTRSGRKLLDRATEIRLRWLAEITEGWSPDDVVSLAGLLRRFLDDATAAEDQP